MYNKTVVLNTHLQKIVESVKLLSSGIIAVILYGGYGRDEGGWIIENNGEYRPYNDYDILLVIKNKISVQQIERLRKELAKRIGIRWIDIGQSTPDELKKIKPSIYSYDLKYASRIIQGNPEILNLIPIIDVSNLPLKEGETLYFTRIWTLLGSLDKKGISIDRKGEESRFFRNQMAKAILAIVDVLLLQKGAYQSSYNERVKRINDLYSPSNELCKLAKWALEEKLFPKAPNMTALEIKKLYQKVHYYYFREMYILLTKYYGCRINSPKGIERNLKWGFSNFIKRVGWVCLRRNLNWERRLNINLAQSYIAASYLKGINNRQFLQKGISYIRRLDRTFNESASWDEARVRVAELRMEV